MRMAVLVGGHDFVRAVIVEAEKHENRQLECELDSCPA
jgi:hypothetical protein